MDFQQKRFFLLTSLIGLVTGSLYLAFDIAISDIEPLQASKTSSIHTNYQSTYIDKIKPIESIDDNKDATQTTIKQEVEEAQPKIIKTNYVRPIVQPVLSVATYAAKRISEKQADTPKIAKTHNKPKMVIILDDVSTSFQTDMIKRTGLAITPSFFPFERIFQKNASLANEFPSYMIHLPLEAMNYAHPEKSTLTTTSTSRSIAQTVEKAKRLLPHAKYINNHTGSKFTSNTQAMTKLIRVLDDNNLKFLDSVTTHKTVANQVAAYKVLKRDIFIDHEDNLEYIKTQIGKAIEKAKKNQVAIVIGHPRVNTLLALNEYKHRLQKEVDIVYIDEL